MLYELLQFDGREYDFLNLRYENMKCNATNVILIASLFFVLVSQNFDEFMTGL